MNINIGNLVYTIKFSGANIDIDNYNVKTQYFFKNSFKNYALFYFAAEKIR